MTYVLRVAQLQRDIYGAQYYVPLWENVLTKHNMTPDLVGAFECDENDLSAMLNDFWNELPDHPSIRTPEFFALCDLCEYEFE